MTESRGDESRGGRGGPVQPAGGGAAAWLTELPVRLLRSQLVRASALMFSSVALTRLLGFGFPVVSARALAQSDFGLVTYTLAVAGLASTLLFNAPGGLSPALARSHHDPQEQDAIFSNHVAVVGVLLAVSLLATVPVELVVRLPIPVFGGLLANLLGTATLVLYRELQRGRERFRTVSAYYVLANLIQLAAVTALWLLGSRHPASYIAVFGLSAVAAVLVMQPFSPVGIRFIWRAVDRRRMLKILEFALPLVLQSAFFMIWSNVDVVLLQLLRRLDVVGQYGAAKSLSNAAFFAGSAIATVLSPGAARLSQGEYREYIRKVLLLVTGVTVPAVVAVAVLSPWLLVSIFGPSYRPAAPALTLLAVGTGMYGVSLTLEATWIAIGRPGLSTAATGAAATVTLLTAPGLIGALGLAGAALAVVFGSAARLALLGFVSARSVRWPASRGAVT